MAEAREHLATIETDLLAIEDSGADIDEERVNKVFRAAHSIKGASGFFGLDKIKELAHKAETVLDLIRSRKLLPNAEIINLLLGAFDKLREMVNDPGQSESADTQSFLAGLVSLAQSIEPRTPLNLIGTIVSATGTELPVIIQDDAFEVSKGEPASEPNYVYEVQLDLFADVEKQGRTLSELIDGLRSAGEIVDCSVDGDSPGSLESPGGRKLPTKITFSSRSRIDATAAPFFISNNQIKLLSGPAESEPSPEPLGEEPASPAPVVAPSPPEARPSPSPSRMSAPAVPVAKEREGAASEGTLRVSVELLESLMNLAGELVLSRNQLRAVLSQHKLRGVQASFQRINLVTSELQDAIMQTRMQPIGNVFAKFPRVVRDMARNLKKDIQLDIRGKDVGLDKSLIEGLSDPLTHMVRNAADHGIESVEERLRAGKRATGTLRIEARHEAGQVVLEIADDGKGLDPDRIAAAAVTRGLISPEAMQGMSDQEKMHLIFLPGLSTAEKVTDVSGRGVGMDVVKTNLARLGGKVDIESEIGQGTLFRIKLPLTLAIIPSLVVSVNDERFAIPQISVVELLRIRAEKVKERIEVIGDAEVLVLRDELIPIVRFADILGIKHARLDPETGEASDDRRGRLADRRSFAHVDEGAARSDAIEQRHGRDRRQSASSDLEIVVVNTGAMKYGLVVDYFLTGEEIVVKPLGRHLKGLPEYAGATIMGDGTVALIVDAAGLAAKAQLANVAASAREAEVENTTDKLVENRSFLLFNNGREELCATPLESVVRVEKVTRKQVENIGGKRTMQYRGKLPAPGHPFGCRPGRQHRRGARARGHRGPDRRARGRSAGGHAGGCDRNQGHSRHRYPPPDRHCRLDHHARRHRAGGGHLRARTNHVPGVELAAHLGSANVGIKLCGGAGRGFGLLPRPGQTLPGVGRIRGARSRGRRGGVEALARARRRGPGPGDRRGDAKPDRPRPGFARSPGREPRPPAHPGAHQPGQRRRHRQGQGRWGGRLSNQAGPRQSTHLPACVVGRTGCGRAMRAGGGAQAG